MTSTEQRILEHTPPLVLMNPLVPPAKTHCFRVSIRGTCSSALWFSNNNRTNSSPSGNTNDDAHSAAPSLQITWKNPTSKTDSKSAAAFFPMTIARSGMKHPTCQELVFRTAAAAAAAKEEQRDCAVLVKDTSKPRNTVFHLYGVAPYCSNNKVPSAQSRSGQALYRWGTVVATGQNNNNNKAAKTSATLEMANGMVYRAEPAVVTGDADGGGYVFEDPSQPAPTSLPPQAGDFQIVAVKPSLFKSKKDDDNNNNNKGVPCGLFQWKEDGWDVMAGPGVDVCLMIAFGVILDDVLARPAATTTGRTTFPKRHQQQNNLQQQDNIRSSSTPPSHQKEQQQPTGQEPLVYSVPTDKEGIHAVEVPQGIRGGQIFDVVVVDGSMVRVTCPHTAAPGHTVRFRTNNKENYKTVAATNTSAAGTPQSDSNGGERRSTRKPMMHHETTNSKKQQRSGESSQQQQRQQQVQVVSVPTEKAGIHAVQVPKGIRGGQTFDVVVVAAGGGRTNNDDNDGKESAATTVMRVTCPKTAKPGTTIRFRVDSNSNKPQDSKSQRVAAAAAAAERQQMEAAILQSVIDMSKMDVQQQEEEPVHQATSQQPSLRTPPPVRTQPAQEKIPAEESQRTAESAARQDDHDVCASELFLSTPIFGAANPGTSLKLFVTKLEAEAKNPATSDVDALRALAYCCDRGIGGVDQDAERALSLYNRADALVLAATKKKSQRRRGPFRNKKRDPAATTTTTPTTAFATTAAWLHKIGDPRVAKYTTRVEVDEDIGRLTQLIQTAKEANQVCLLKRAIEAEKELAILSDLVQLEAFQSTEEIQERISALEQRTKQIKKLEDRLPLVETIQHLQQRLQREEDAKRKVQSQEGAQHIMYACSAPLEDDDDDVVQGRARRASLHPVPPMVIATPIFNPTAH